MSPKNKKVARRKAKSRKERIQLSRSKTRLFSLIALSIPVLFILFLEIVLRLLNYGGDNRLFVPTPTEDSKYYGINRSVCRRYFVRDDFVPTPRKDLFLREKPEGTFRIFVLGGSTTAGFPYAHNVSFPRILHRRLTDTFPDRRIEVVNTAMTAINSYTLLDFMDEILKQKPDAILIYAGHNEFYGALGVGSVESLGQYRWIVQTYLNLQTYKTFLLARDGIHAIQRMFRKDPETENLFDPSETQMARIVKEKEILLNSDLYKRGRKQFESNLCAIYRKVDKAGIPVLISELVSNIRDQKPFVSIPSDTLPSALSIYQEARLFERNGEYDLARKRYYKAKDLDALRFRATEDFNQVIHAVAEKYNSPVVPMQTYFELASLHGLIGNNLMHEHLHPNIDGYFLMADAFYQAMQQHEFIDSEWPAERIRPSDMYQKRWGFTSLDSTYAAMTIAHLKGGWPFKKTGPNRALEMIHPKTKAESISLKKLKTESMTFEMGHLELARYFEEKGEIQKAIEEYRSLIYSVPYLDLFYEPAIHLLLKKERYEEVLDILLEGVKYNQSFFMYKWIGQISLATGETHRGVQFLEQARQINPHDEILLYNLARGYYHLRRIENGDQIAALLRQLAPNAQALSILADFRQSMINQIQSN